MDSVKRDSIQQAYGGYLETIKALYVELYRAKFISGSESKYVVRATPARNLLSNKGIQPEGTVDELIRIVDALLEEINTLMEKG